MLRVFMDTWLVVECLYVSASDEWLVMPTLECVSAEAAAQAAASLQEKALPGRVFHYFSVPDDTSFDEAAQLHAEELSMDAAFADVVL